ncbi:MAG: transposase [Flavobacteriaceae bacterium]|nr:transposase [Flavobacteriaceae bacterium]
MKNRKRNRLKGYDYSRDNLYFVTICVQDRVCCFGEIVASRDANRNSGAGRDLPVHHPDDPKMRLNAFGLIVQNQLIWLENQYEYAVLHNFVVMPNHVHAIIEIDSLRVKGKEMKIKSLSSLMGAFKTTSSKLIHQSGFLDFSWQRSFHDRIIRDEKAYTNISNYIEKNPKKWYVDSFYKKG